MLLFSRKFLILRPKSANSGLLAFADFKFLSYAYYPVHIAYYTMLIKLCQQITIIGIMNNKKSELSAKICLRIKFERIKRNFSQEQLAELAELNRNTIGNIERGIASPTVDTLEKLAKAFDMNILELMDISNIYL